jgi:hypothetical protein
MSRKYRIQQHDMCEDGAGPQPIASSHGSSRDAATYIGLNKIGDVKGELEVLEVEQRVSIGVITRMVSGGSHCVVTVQSVSLVSRQWFDGDGDGTGN